MSTDKTLTSSGFYVSQEAPIHSDNPVPTPHGAAARHPALRVHGARRHRPRGIPRLLRRRARPVRHRGGREAVYLRSHGGVHPPQPRAAQGSGRRGRRVLVPRAHPPRTSTRRSRSTRSSDAASSAARRASRRASATRCASTDPLGFPYEFFYDVEHVERLSWRYDLHTPGELVRLDHFNQVTPDVPRAVNFMQSLGFRVTEDIQDDEGTVYAAWMRRKPTVHDTAMTGGDGPRMHHVAFATHEKHNILAICDKLGALRRSDAIERGPGRHGVSNAFYLYLRDPDGHRVEIYTQDYYTGDPDNPVDHVGRARQPAPRLVGQPGRAVLVHRGLARARPRRQPAAGRRPHRHVRDGGHDRRGRVLVHAPGRRARGAAELEAGRVQARPPAVVDH